MRTARPTHIGKILSGFQHLQVGPNTENPVDPHFQNETFRFLMNEWTQENPRGPLKTFIKWQKAQGLI